MKIKTKLSITAVVSIGLALLVGITLFLTSGQVQKAVLENQLVDEIVAKVNLPAASCGASNSSKTSSPLMGED